MRKREKHLSHGLSFTALALCVALMGPEPATHSSIRYATLPLGSSIILATPENTAGLFREDDPSVRTALRLQQRLRSKGLPATLQNAVAAIRERQRLLRQSIAVSFLIDSVTAATWEASPQHHPLWIAMTADGTGIRVGLNRDQIEAALTEERIGSVPRPQNVRITGLHDGTLVNRILSDGVARPGYRINQELTKSMLIAALLENRMESRTEIEVPLVFTPGRLENPTSIPLGDLTLLASGHSNFKGSPWGRVANVRKALRDHVNNVVVAPGEVFSFNAALGDTLAKEGRWEQAKVINNGVLTMEQGGGICQVSTTLFRGVLHAGFPVLERKSHSMYVSYYEVGGVGLDATVYKGDPDLTFLNDTGNPIVLQAYDDGDDAYVHIYGTPDGRVATLDGPYFAQTAPADFSDGGRALNRNEIGWRHRVVYADGSVKSDAVISTYKSLPKSIVYKYTALSAL